MIYLDSDVCRWHVDQLDLDPTLNVAVYHMPYPYRSSFADTVCQAVAKYDRIAVLISELHLDSAGCCLDIQDPKIQYFVCGFINGINAVPWMDWFINTVVHYKNNQLLDQLTPYEVKPKAFDILLGQPKPHRYLVQSYIRSLGLNDQVIMTMLQDNNLSPIKEQDESNWLWEPGVNAHDTLRSTITAVNYQGTNMSLSQVIPFSVYNQTAYTVVAETNYDNHYSFYTEKIVKPILAERLFVVFSSRHYLKNLRSLGFKTFDGIIDESYDDMEDYDARFKLVCEQIKYLISQPQEDILARTRPITEHNKRVMLTTDWHGNVLKSLQEFLLGQQQQN
jgi:hypothetical protein